MLVVGAGDGSHHARITSPIIEERQGLLKDFVCLFKLNLGFVRTPVLLALLAITLCGDLPVKALTGSPPLIFWMTRIPLSGR